MKDNDKRLLADPTPEKPGFGWWFTCTLTRSFHGTSFIFG
jgi:hypothetical protein